MTHVEVGVTGAKRVSVEEANTRHLLINIMEQHPQDSETKLLQRYREQIKDDPEMLDVVIGYKFANDYAAICNPRRPRWRDPEAVTKAVSHLRVGLRKHIEEKAQEMLMDMAMPNGRRLGDCTIAYVGRLGGWLSRIAEGKNPRQTVGHVYDEEQLRELRKAK